MFPNFLPAYFCSPYLHNCRTGSFSLNNEIICAEENENEIIKRSANLGEGHSGHLVSGKAGSLILSCERACLGLSCFLPPWYHQILLPTSNVLPSQATSDVLLGKLSKVSSLPESHLSLDLTSAILDSSTGLFCLVQKVSICLIFEEFSLQPDA